MTTYNRALAATIDWKPSGGPQAQPATGFGTMKPNQPTPTNRDTVVAFLASQLRSHPPKV